jgi:hypothetical protein
MGTNKRPQYLQAEFWIILAVIGLLIGLFGCNNDSGQTPAEEAKAKQSSAQQTANEWVTVTREGCEYWVHPYNTNYNNATYAMTHKGTCPNPKHVYNEQ